MNTAFTLRIPVLLAALFLLGRTLCAGESPFLYGIFGYDPANPDDIPTEYLSHITNGAGPGWITATVAVGTDTNQVPRVDFTPLSNRGHTIICRLNNGYFPNGTIPLTNKYDDFAQCCAIFATNSSGCHIWTIGNELNISGEWPFDPALGKFPCVTPESYALCFRKVYNAIKAVHPQDKVIPEAPACFSGPFSAGTMSYLGVSYPYDANPLTWVQHLNQVLTAITTTGPNPGPPDGIALHVSSRGYHCSDIHSTARFGNGLYNSFYVYQDWVNLGIPAALYNLPLYMTECNGYYNWKGGHPENPAAHYEAGWMQEVFAEISRYNQSALATGKPVFRCVNMYRWCASCDPWNIDGEPYKDQILADLDQAVAQKYTWPNSYTNLLLPVGLNFLQPPPDNQTLDICGDPPAGVVPQKGWVNLTQGGTGNNVDAGGGISVTWSTFGGGTHAFSLTTFPNTGGDYNLFRGYLDTGDTSATTVTVTGLKFPLYDVIVYCDGDNGSAVRVGKYTLTATSGSATKYVRDDSNTDFSGAYIEADSTTGGPSAPAGNYCRFPNVHGSSFTVAATGDYGSDNHPRAPINAMQIVPVNQEPVIEAVLRPEALFRFVVPSPNTNGDHLTFSLDPGAPAGACINSTNGAFRWRPTRQQSSATYTITVRITDNDVPELNTLETLVLTVLPYLELTIGSTAVQAGGQAGVPVYLASSDGVTNLVFTIDWPADRFTNPMLAVTTPDIASSSLQDQTTNLVIRASGQVLPGTNQILSLSYQTVPSQSSAFVALPVGAIRGTRTGALDYACYFTHAGRVAVVNREPLLEAFSSTDLSRSLTAFGKVGVGYQLQYSTNLAPPVTWYPLSDHAQTNVAQPVNVDSANPMIFYRLLQQ